MRLRMHTRLLPVNPASVTFTTLQDGLVTIADASTANHLAAASRHLASSHLVAFPTETVYGLGANALCPTAVPRIYAAKGRPSDNPLIIHVSSLAMLARLLPPSYSIPPIYSHLIHSFWPGPLTLLFPASAKVPAITTASLPTMAIRMPSHPIARALISLADCPVAAPSANTSGKPSPTTAAHVQQDLEGKLEYILDGGPCQVGLESTVASLEDNTLTILRLGGVSTEAIQSCLQSGGFTDCRVRVYHKDFRDKEMENKPATPGMKYRHYSPNAKVVILSGPEQAEQNAGWLVFRDGQYDSQSLQNVCYLGAKGDVHEAAKNLFSGLRELDSKGCDVIYVEPTSEDGIGAAYMERLRKAAGLH